MSAIVGLTDALRISLIAIAALTFAGCATTRRAPNLWLAHAAAAGNVQAQYSLGWHELVGGRTPAVRADGVRLIREAANAGFAAADNLMGIAYLHGLGVTQSTPTALIWLQAGANRGAPAPQILLASLYADGTRVPQNPALAYYWYGIAAKPVRSDVRISNIADLRAWARARMLAIEPKLNAAQIRAEDRRIAAWTPIPS
ncbi:MAG: sel1 repeat family protein, partial [Steroidobacteraceae bacterium]|nr:sel1 repeat family protein [Steroidobacteraceae bacterium]